ncbi:GTP cyclohydrolase II [Lysobacter sp. A289]
MSDAKPAIDTVTSLHAATGANPNDVDAGLETSAERAPRLDYVDSCDLPTPWASFRMHGFADRVTGGEHVVLTLGSISDGEPVLARVHSECLTGDAMFSRRCDCGAQLEEALKRIATEGRGMLLYLRQEGRGIGLLNKIRAYALQDAGADTVEANEALGFAPDLRDYGICKPMLAHFDVNALRLMTNNPAKVKAMQAVGVAVTERVAILVGHNPSNRRYLATKQDKLGHLIDTTASAKAPAHD